MKIERLRKVFDLSDGRKLNAVVLALIGKVEASTIAVLQEEFDALCGKENMHVVVEMSKMEYTTSTGMGAMVQYASSLEQHGGRLSLLSPAESVRHVIQLLGLDQFLPMFENEQDLCANYLSTSRRPSGSVAKQEQIDLAVHRAKASLGFTSKIRPVLSGAIVLAMPEMHFFYELLKDGALSMGWKVHFALNSKEVWKMVQTFRPAVLLVDYALDGFEDLCLSIKTQPETSACSIVKIYPEGQEIGKSQRLSVIPNEFICEPCSINQLLSFIGSEVKRHENESNFFHHELFFSFPSQTASIAKVNALLERIIIKSIKASNERLMGYLAAVREAIDNAHRHGHAKNSEAHIRVLYLRNDEKISINIKDEGPGFAWKNYLEAAAQTEPISLAQARPIAIPGGLGISLMSRACDHLSYNELGNEIELSLSVKSCLP